MTIYNAGLSSGTLGKENCLKYGLIYDNPNRDYVNDYSESVMPAALNECATAALRYYHSQIEGHLK